MTTFTVRGGRNGSQVHVTWADGKLSGDPPTVDLVELEAELVAVNRRDRQSWSHVVDPDGDLPQDPLLDPTAAWRLIRSVLDTVQTGSGDLPAEAAALLERPSRRA